MPEPGSARRWRQLEQLDARLAGRGTPTVEQLAPLLGAVILAAVVGSLLLAWAYGQLGLPGLLLMLLVYLAGLVRLVLWRGAVVRRRRGRYTETEAARFRLDRLPAVVLTLLARDGFDVALTDWEGQPRILGVDTDLDLTFRAADSGPDSGSALRPVLRAAGAPAAAGLRVVVSLGQFQRGDIVWASRQGGVHLVDGATLRRWATGTPLQQLLGLRPARSMRRRTAG
jgi:hypothetical protein